jgi:broad specificity phosphatase PhoE
MSSTLKARIGSPKQHAKAAGPSRLFIFARHAESAANTAHVLNSDPAHRFDLTRRGQQQARLLGEQLAHLRIDQAVCTRFLRTRQTIELALANRPIPLRVDADLDEVDAGAFDGAPISAYWAWKERHRPSDRFPGGESLDTAAQRYTAAVRRLLHRREQTTLIVCHELALRAILAAARIAAHGHSQPEVANAVPYLVDEQALHGALGRLEARQSSRPFQDLPADAAA